MRRPADWGQKAADYWEKSRIVGDSHLRQQYIDLAARYLELAQSFENTTAAPGSDPRLLTK